jgi:hypothetical protein
MLELVMHPPSTIICQERRARHSFVGLRSTRNQRRLPDPSATVECRTVLCARASVVADAAPFVT